MKTRHQAIPFIVIATLLVSLLLFAELVTSANAGSQATVKDILDSPNAAAEDFTIEVSINPPPPYSALVPAPKIRVDETGVSYSHGSSIPLTVNVSLSPDFDSDYWQFKNWTGTVETTQSPLPLSATQNYNVTANFSRQCYDLSLGYAGMVSGDVGTKPSVTNGSTFCNAGQFAANESISLLAAGITGYRLIGWSGTLNDSSTEYTNTAKMPIGNHTITAHYELICFRLDTAALPLSTGTVSKNPAPNPNCPAANQGNQYRKDTQVTLTAAPGLGYKFINWTGDTTGSTNNVQMVVNMDKNRALTANFQLACHTLYLTHTGTGIDPIATPEKSPQCLSEGRYVAGEGIALEADAAPNWQVKSWTGADDPNSTSELNTLTFPKLKFDSEGYYVTVNYIMQPTLQFSSGKYSFPENIGEAKILVKRTGSLAETVKVNYATSNGSAKSGLDYDETSGVLTFAPGDEEKTISIKITNDNIKENDENLFLTLSNPTGGAILGTLAEAEIVIQDNEGDPTVQFSTDFYQVDESSSPATITVTLFPASSALVYVELDTMPISASSGEDYAEQSAVPIIFKAGDTSKQVQIDVWDDTLDELDETVQLKLSSDYHPYFGSSEAILTIIDDDSPPTVQFSQSQYYAKEGVSTAPVTVTLSAASALSVTLDYEVIELTVGRLFAGSITFDPGEESRTLDIPVSSYQVGDELNIVLNSADNATLAPPSSAILTILDKNRSDCHRLTLQHNGYGSPPLTTNIDRSQGCALGFFVADELIDVLAQPDLGWTIDGWHGTLNDNGVSDENVVRMPNSDHTVTIYYITYAYLPNILQDFATYFEGPREVEPNNLLSVSQANGPLRSKQPYFGSFPTTGDQFDVYYIYLAR